MCQPIWGADPTASDSTGVTESVFNRKRHSLLSYNTLPHLDRPELADWVTYA